MIHTILHDKQVVLASASPRCEEIFRLLGLSPVIIPADIDEPITSMAPHRQVVKHAYNKAHHVATLVCNDSITIGADTLVVVSNRILGKPADLEQATEYLRLLSGITHKVYTGVSIVCGNRSFSGYELSYVSFTRLTEDEIRDYIATREPLDKAGAYGIQGYGAQFIENIRGCYFNIMGFPINLFYRLLDKYISSNG